MLDELGCFSTGAAALSSPGSRTAAATAAGEKQHRNDTVVAALQILSQLARNSEAYFSQLLAVLVPEKIVQLLCEVRSIIVFSL